MIIITAVLNKDIVGKYYLQNNIVTKAPWYPTRMKLNIEIVLKREKQIKEKELILTWGLTA